MECACFPKAKLNRLARPRFNWPTDAPPMSPCMYWKAAKRRSNLSCGRAWPRFSTSIRKSRVRDSINPATWIMSYTTACIDSSFKDLAPGSARLIDAPPATEASLNSFRVSGKSWSPQRALRTQRENRGDEAQNKTAGYDRGLSRRFRANQLRRRRGAAESRCAQRHQPAGDRAEVLRAGDHAERRADPLQLHHGRFGPDVRQRYRG